MESTIGLMDARHVVSRQPRARRAKPLTGGLSARDDGGDVRQGTAATELEDLWDRHGESAYTMACALLGDGAAAAEAVRLAMLELAGPADGSAAEGTRKSLARHVYRHCQAVEDKAHGSAQLPPLMVWVSQLAQLQRASLALCVFGGLTHREAAALLDVPPRTVAELLSAGLRELGRLAGVAATDTSPGPESDSA
jgi:hypothetical protein